MGMVHPTAEAVLCTDSHGIAEAFEALGIELRYNLRAKRPEWRKLCQGPLAWKTWTDRDQAHYREEAANCFLKETSRGVSRWKLSAEQWNLGFQSLMRATEVDGFMAWLESLPEWDDEPRVERLLADLMKASDDQLSAWAGRYLLCGPIVRAMRPGAKLDEIPVLIGAQGCGKSTFAAYLLPADTRSDWFGDGLDLASTNKEKAESLEGRVVVECAEMAGMSKADRERIKVFMTRQDDGQHRGAYREHRESSPRMCCFVGTANFTGDGVLPHDPSGHRRFVAIEVSGSTREVMRYLDHHRAQLWAEALHRVKVNEPEWEQPWLPEWLKVEQAAVNRRHAAEDSTMLDKVADLPQRFLTLTQAAEFIGMVAKDGLLGRGEQYRLKEALKAEGWTASQRRRDGRVQHR